MLRDKNGAYMDLVDKYKPLQKRRDRIMELMKYKDSAEPEALLKLKTELDDIIVKQQSILDEIGQAGRGDFPHPTDGEGIYKFLVGREGTLRPTANMEGIEQTVSEMLDSYGIMGRKWKDRMSTDYPELYNSENYVIFNEDVAKILERNEMPVKSPLIAHHNLEEGALLKHLGAGGDIPMPSMAVSKVGNPVDNFGEFSLLGDAGLITPSSKTKIYPADMYSGRAPHDTVKYTDPDAVFNSLDPQELQWLVGYTSRGWLTDPKIHHDLQLDQPTKTLASEKKIDYSTKIGKGYLKQIREKFDSLDPGALERQMKQVEEMKQLGYEPYDFENFRDMINEVSKMERAKGNTEFLQSRYHTPHISESEMLGLTTRMMTNPKGYRTPTGKKRADIPYDPETALKVMRKKKAYEVGAENYEGSGQTRALTASPFKNLEEVKANRDKIIDREEGSYFKEDFSEARSIANEEISKYARLSYNDKEMVNNMIEDILRTGKMSWFYRDKVDQSVRGEVGKEHIESIVDALKQKGKDLETDYFESKTNRLVNLNEFKGAIIPKETPAYIEALLKDAGIQKILRYGSHEQRKKLFDKFPELHFIGLAIPTAGLLSNFEEEKQGLL